MKAVTLTLNPAYDLYCHTEKFLPYRENLVRLISRDAGGKGINLGRGLAAVNVPCVNFAVLGDESAEDFARILKNEGLDLRFITVGGRIRENITVASDSEKETRISFPGFSADDGMLEAVFTAVAPLIDENTAVTFCGRAPAGITREGILSFLHKIKSLGAKLVIDTHALDRDDVLSLSPFLIKPNGEEAPKYRISVESIEECVRDAAALCREGVENVMVSLGEVGAVLVTAEGGFFAKAPEISVRSTVGAGDSSIAGFLYGEHLGYSAEEKLRCATAFGSAACLIEGVGAPRTEDVFRLLREVEIKKVN